MKDRLVTLGPGAVPTVPVTDFSRVPLCDAELRQLWNIVGPTVERNLDRAPLWKVITAVYFEGLMHGAGLEAERHTIAKLKDELPPKKEFHWSV